MIPKSIGRYRDFINADYGHSFSEWLGIKPVRTETRYVLGVAEYRMSSPRACGEWKLLKKSAKASYKSALAKARNHNG